MTVFNYNRVNPYGTPMMRPRKFESSYEAEQRIARYVAHVASQKVWEERQVENDAKWLDAKVAKQTGKPNGKAAKRKLPTGDQC